MTRRRLDEELVSRRLAPNLQEARKLVESRSVAVDGAPALKAGTLVAPASNITLAERRVFASRGGLKLQGALEDFGIDVTGMHCLDAGAGSGGFTDCLLRAGAAHVVAVDVGYGQFDWRLRNDPRVKLLERTNVRSIAPEEGPFDLIVADLSFVSLTSIAPTLARLALPDALCVLLVKPQFEAPPGDVGPRGIVSEPAVWKRALTSVASALAEVGLGTLAIRPSRVKGATGNQEFFALARPGTSSPEDLVERALAALGDAR